MNNKHSSPELTLEDLATFKRCRSESFWHGCVPMMMGAGLAVGLAHSRGYFTSRPRLLIPTYLLAGVSGYLGGKLSYIGKCKRMFLELNDSRIKDAMQGNRQQIPRVGSDMLFGQDSVGPLVVETPTNDEEMTNNPKQPMTYAQRREFFRNQRPPNFAPLPQTPPPNVEENSPTYIPPHEVPPPPPSSLSSDYFDQERPLSSFLFEDTYSPKD